MALLLRDDSGGKRLEVRAAGRTRRLYVDGVLHTQYNPSQPLTGSVWDHLALSALLAPDRAIERVLVLGLGGGAVVHLLRRIVRPREIVAVELDARRIAVARDYFIVEGDDIQLVEADAREWLAAHGGPPFQLVIEDLFSEERGEPVRPFSFDESWCEALLAVLDVPGWLVVNFLPRRALDAAPITRQARYRQRFPAAFRFSDPRLDNAVAAFCGLPVTPRAFRRRLAQHPELAGARARELAAAFSVHALWR